MYYNNVYKRNACKAKKNQFARKKKPKQEQTCSTLYTHMVGVFLSHTANLGS